MLKKIRLKNWKTHLESEITFEKGINCILGKMGSGKTSILEAICFALYGTLPAVQSRKRKISDLIMRYPTKKTEAEVELEIEIGNGRNLSILRRINAKKGTYYSEVRLNGKLIAGPQTAEVTEKVFEIIKIDYDTFVQIIYGEQNNIDSILIMNPSKRKEKIDELLRIDKLEVSRSVIVSLINRIKRKIKELDDERRKRRHEFKEEEKQKMISEIKNIKEEIEKKVEELSFLNNEKNKIEKKVEELEERKKILDKIHYEFKSKTAVKEHLTKEIERIKAFYGWVDNKKELNRRIEDLEKIENEYNKTVLKLERKRELLNNLRVSISKLKENLKHLDELKRKIKGKDVNKIEKEIDRLSSKEKEIINNIGKLKAKRDEISEVLEIIESKKENEVVMCPVCDSKISPEKIEAIKKNKMEEMRKVEEELKKMREEIKRIDNMKKTLESEKMEIIKMLEQIKNMKRVEEELETLEKNKLNIQNEVVELEKKVKSIDIESVKKEKMKIEKLFEALEKMEKIEKIEEELNNLRSRIAEISFDEKELKLWREKMLKVVSEVKGKEEEIKGLKRLLEEKQRNLMMLEKIEKIIKDIEEKIEKYEKIIDFLEKLKMVIEKTQIDLREEFISAINNQMNRIWEIFYPYEDYQDIRLFPEDNYSLKLLNSEGEWVNAESFVSGGERMMAALTLRLAMASILSPSFKMIILDEPTHNLDSTGVEELGRMLKERMKKILEQTILITHDSLLAETSADKIFVFERGKDKTGFTKIQKL